MAKRLQLRTGTTTQHNTFTGALGEVSVDTDKDVLVVHDGTTAGGHPVSARANNDGTISFIAKDGTVRATINTANKVSATRFVSVKNTSSINDVSYSGANDPATGVDITGGVINIVSGSVVLKSHSGTSTSSIIHNVPAALYPDFSVRAWVNFNGTTTPPSVRGSGNVSSVVRNATGDYTVTFTTAMPDANYSVSGSLKTQDNNLGANNQAVLNPYNFTSTSFRFIANDGGALRDAIHCNITVTR